MSMDNLPQLLFDATLLFAFWMMYRVMQILLKPIKKPPKRDKLKEIQKILDSH